MVGRGEQPILQIGAPGTLCLGGQPFARWPALTTVAGAMSLTVELSALPFDPPVAVLPGETWRFQAWAREPSPGMPKSAFTNVVALTFP